MGNKTLLFDNSPLKYKFTAKSGRRGKDKETAECIFSSANLAD
ncbi:hypothetical protein HMPREF1146_0861 [Prevotella sp. MSX73]|nr:hypothetical protein HMPREF1146_0861 [Prevotella sp. MSX73]